ncbi:MAG: hypothetical protein R3B39_02005 [Candidatus Paceibacterota bacterium]
MLLALAVEGEPSTWFSELIGSYPLIKTSIADFQGLSLVLA